MAHKNDDWEIIKMNLFGKFSCSDFHRVLGTRDRFPVQIQCEIGVENSHFS